MEILITQIFVFWSNLDFFETGRNIYGCQGHIFTHSYAQEESHLQVSIELETCNHESNALPIH